MLFALKNFDPFLSEKATDKYGITKHFTFVLTHLSIKILKNGDIITARIFIATESLLISQLAVDKDNEVSEAIG